MNGIKKENKLSFKPSKRFKKALKELDKVESGKIKLKGYNNMTDLIKELNRE